MDLGRCFAVPLPYKQSFSGEPRGPKGHPVLKCNILVAYVTAGLISYFSISRWKIFFLN